MPGLVADADTLEVLIQDLRQIVADLLYLNRDPMGGAVPFRVTADREEHAAIA